MPNLDKIVTIPWREKAHKIVAELCFASWERANRLANGSVRKVHRPYSVPAEASYLVDCLATDAEENAKAFFLRWNYMRA